ncbi:MAG: aromatic ring-hydroxylating oxygenase subunit alpha [Fimbriimonas sp.]
MEIHPNIGAARTIPSRFYTDPAIFADAKERIFARTWQWVSDTDGLRAPGTVAPHTLLEGCLDEPIVVTRDMNDQIHVVSNVCTHRGMLVAESGGNERFLRCRYHGRRFGLDGCFQFMPEFDGVSGFPSEADSLPKIPHDIWGKFLFASVDPLAGLSDFLKPVIERLGWLPLQEFSFEPSRARDYLVKAHWALYVDNYLEGFHIPFIHAGLNESLDYGNYITEQYDWSNLQCAHGKPGEDKFDLPVYSPDYGKPISAYYYWVFPNLMLNFYPWGLSINVVRPLGPELTKVSFLPYVWNASRLGMGAGAELDRVEREDEVVVEAVQRGLKSRLYDRGRYSPAREANVHHFHQLLAKCLTS